MNDSTEQPAASGFNRYIPLAVYGIIFLTFLYIPLRITGYGYLPPDDALRHAAKAVSGKPWPQILVLGEDYKIDHNFGWDHLLAQVHHWFHWNAEALVVFSIVALFALVGWSALPWLKRPEVWLGVVALYAIATTDIERLFLGRPFLLTKFALLMILFAWQCGDRSRPPGTRTAIAIAALISIAVFVHGVWYLWFLPFAAFILAREFRWALVFGIGWFVGVILGSSFTGHPIDYVVSAFNMASKAVSLHATQRTLVTEFQPASGDFPALIILVGMLALRALTKLDSRPLLRDPAFWLVCTCWLLGFVAKRFWVDWGWTALMVLIAADLNRLLQLKMPADSLKRLALTSILAAAAFLACTSDRDSRWTRNLTNRYLQQSNPELAGWLPDKGGVLYSSEMGVFYHTFFENPNADWRYILGYEPAIMPKEDFDTYHRIRWNYGDYSAYEPWVDKMRPQDRLIMSGIKLEQPKIPELEWNFVVSSIWIGRLPRTNSIVPPSAQSLTNSPTE